jgi:hypothetical protein
MTWPGGANDADLLYDFKQILWFVGHEPRRGDLAL